MTTAGPTERCSEVLAELAWVRALARHLLQDPGLADDVAHDTWLAALQRPPTIQPGRGLRPWLAVTVRNRVRRMARGERRRARREAAVTTRSAAPSALDVVARADLHREVTTVVMGLDEPYRSAILLRFLDERSYAEVADSQGITEAAARKRVSRGLQQLRDRLAAVHPGGFAAWSAAWTNQLVATPVGVGASGTLSTLVLTPILTMLPIHWLLAGVAATLAFTVWTFWPAPPVTSERSSFVGEPSAAIADGVTPRHDDAPDPGRRELATAPHDGIELEVVDSADRACAQMTVLPLREPELLAHATTDGAGIGRFGAVAAKATHWVLAARGRLPVRLSAQAGLASARLRLPLGARVAGSVRGRPAGESIQLRLELDTPLVWLAELDAAVHRALGQLGISDTTIETGVDAESRFAFEGLPLDWSGALSPVAAYGLREPSGRGAVEADSTLLLLAPADDLVLELRAPTFVRGRIVSVGAPLSGIGVAILGQQAAPTALMQNVVTGADGRFELTLRRGLRDESEVRALLCVRSGDDIVLQRALRAAATDPEIELGDLEVGRSLSVRVLDADEVPVAGARVHVAAAQSATVVAAVTDAIGHATLAAVPANAALVVVGAFGHRSAAVPLPTEPGPLEVRLARGNGLEVRVRDAAGRPARETRLRVSADRLPFVAPGSSADSFGSPRPFAREFEVDDDGRVELPDLTPGLLLELAVLDALGAVLERRDVVTPPAERCDLLELQVSVATFELRGLVHDERGRGIPRAHVALEIDGAATSARSDAAGRFVLGPLAHRSVTGASTGHLEVQHPAFVPWVRSEWRFDPTSALDIELRRGRRLRAVVSQTDSTPVVSQLVTARFADGCVVLGDEVEPGRYEFARAPAEPGVLHVEIAGKEFTAPLVAHAEHAELHVPLLASVTIALAAPPSLARGQRVCVVISASGAAAPIERRFFDVEFPERNPLRLSLVPGTYRFELERRTLGVGRKPESLGLAQELVLRASESITVILP